MQTPHNQSMHPTAIYVVRLLTTLFAGGSNASQHHNPVVASLPFASACAGVAWHMKVGGFLCGFALLSQRSDLESISGDRTLISP